MIATNPFVTVMLTVGGAFVLFAIVRAHRQASQHVILKNPAHIANDLGEIVEVGKNTKIRILGYDLYCFQDDEYVWRPTLEDWLEKGAKVEYYVQECDDKSQQEVLAFSKEDHGPGTFQVKRIQETRDNRHLLEPCRTFHWTLVYDPDQIWVEGYHKPRTNEAMKCEYRRISRSSKRFKKFERQLDILTCDAVPVV